MKPETHMISAKGHATLMPHKSLIATGTHGPGVWWLANCVITDVNLALSELHAPDSF